MSSSAVHLSRAPWMIHQCDLPVPSYRCAVLLLSLFVSPVLIFWREGLGGVAQGCAGWRRVDGTRNSTGSQPKGKGKGEKKRRKKQREELEQPHDSRAFHSEHATTTSARSTCRRPCCPVAVSQLTGPVIAAAELTAAVIAKSAARRPAQAPIPSSARPSSKASRPSRSCRPASRRGRQRGGRPATSPPPLWRTSPHRRRPQRAHPPRRCCRRQRPPSPPP